MRRSGGDVPRPVEGLGNEGLVRGAHRSAARHRLALRAAGYVVRVRRRLRRRRRSKTHFETASGVHGSRTTSLTSQRRCRPPAAFLQLARFVPVRPRLRAIGVRVDGLCHIEDQLSVEFLVASRVSLARAADAEVDACSNGDGAAAALHNSATNAPGTNAAEPSGTPTGAGCAGVNNDRGEAQPPSSAGACGVYRSAREEALQRGTLDVAAVVDVVLQERSTSRPATLADARNFLASAGPDKAPCCAR